MTKKQKPKQKKWTDLRTKSWDGGRRTKKGERRESTRERESSRGREKREAQREEKKGKNGGRGRASALIYQPGLQRGHLYKPNTLFK